MPLPPHDAVDWSRVCDDEECQQFPNRCDHFALVHCVNCGRKLDVGADDQTPPLGALCADCERQRDDARRDEAIGL